MDINKETREEIKWSYPAMGTFEATILNGRIENVKFLDSNSAGSCISSNVEFLKAVNKSLTELFDHIEGPKESAYDIIKTHLDNKTSY